MNQSCALVFLLFIVEFGASVPLSEFYSFGTDQQDAAFVNVDDDSALLDLRTIFLFYGQQYMDVYVNSNGILSFNTDYEEFTSEPFPLPDPLVAPFWADVDTRGAGSVYYREATDSAVVNKVTGHILLAFPSQPPFTASSVVVTTWDRVGYFDRHTNKLNTFQCVLATDGSRSYIIFLYLDNGIQWTTGDDSGGINGLGGIPAYVGLNAGDGLNYISVNSSRTPAVIDIETTSNVGVAGLWIFQVNEANTVNGNGTSNGCAPEIDPDWEIYWPFVAANTTAMRICPGDTDTTGIATRYCDISGNWLPVDVNDCRTLIIEEISRLVHVHSMYTYCNDITISFFSAIC